MAWFKNLNLFVKISVIVVLALLIFIINTGYSTKGMLSTQKDLLTLEKEVYEIVQLATVNNVLLMRSDELYTQAVTFNDLDLKESAEKNLAELKDNIANLKRLDQKNAEHLRNLEENIIQYQTLSSRIVDELFSDDADFAAIGDLAAGKATLFDESNVLLDDYKKIVDRGFMELITNTRMNGEDTLRFAIVFGVSMMMVLLVVAFSVAKSISGTVNALRRSLAELADGEGDLERRVDVNGTDELGNVALNFNRFMDTLTDTIKKVIAGSEPISTSAETLVNTAKTARSVMELQAQNAQTAGQSMEEFRSSVQEITESASDARNEVYESEQELKAGLEIVQKTISNSVTFGQQINQAATAVQELAEGTQSVNSILDVIKSIAEQTNLLALNAAIEAARAGEQGRGFAVVADEVRSLASRTGEATTEIFDVLEKLRVNAEHSVALMNTSQEKSALNEEYSRNTGEALEKVRQRVDSITALNEKVATSTEQQSLVINSVAEIIHTMNMSVNQASDSFMELDTIAKNLHQASDQLNQSTSQFKL